MNNPVTGLLILVGLWITGPWLGLAATVGVVAATGTALLLGLDRDVLRAGLFGFNGTLVGAGLATFLTPEFSLVVGVYVVLVAAASTVVTVALTRLLLPTVGLPPLTLPFNLVTLAMLLAAYGMSSAEPAPRCPPRCRRQAPGWIPDCVRGRATRAASTPTPGCGCSWPSRARSYAGRERHWVL